MSYNEGLALSQTILATLRDEEAWYFRAVRWLVDPGLRATGRTYLLAVACIDAAISNPTFPIRLSDHMDDPTLANQILRILEELTPQFRWITRRFRLLNGTLRYDPSEQWASVGQATQQGTRTEPRADMSVEQMRVVVEGLRRGAEAQRSSEVESGGRDRILREELIRINDVEQARRAYLETRFHQITDPTVYRRRLQRNANAEFTEQPGPSQSATPNSDTGREGTAAPQAEGPQV